MGIRVGIVGAGNCAKSLVEGLALYAGRPQENIGLTRPQMGSYLVADIEIVAAFDIDQRKVGKPLHQALTSEPNRTMQLCVIPHTAVIVERGPTADSLIQELTEYYIHESTAPAVDVAAVLRTAATDILLNYLPTGSNVAARTYADAALEAGCSFINCMPAPLAKDSQLARRFATAGLVLLGDDIKSQCGATVLNRILLDMLRSRGTQVTSSTQTNYGGNSDHFNLQFRGADKEKSKESALRSVMAKDDAMPHVSMRYEQNQYDHKRAEIIVTGKIFGLAPVNITVMLEDEDSPNSAGVVVDAIRAAKILRDSGRPELASELGPFLMKSPPIQMGELEASTRFDFALNEALHTKERSAKSDSPECVNFRSVAR